MLDLGTEASEVGDVQSESEAASELSTIVPATWGPDVELSHSVLASRATPPLSSLTVLNLSGLGLTRFDLARLVDCTLLHTLILRENHIEKLTSSSVPRALWRLDLYGNRLTQIDALHEHAALGEVDLRHNMLTWKGVAPFLRATCLVSLGLSGNRSLQANVGDYRYRAVRMCAGLMVLDDVYVAPHERAYAASLCSDETVSIAPTLAPKRAGTNLPRLPPIADKLHHLHLVSKRATLASQAGQLVSLLLTDLELVTGRAYRGATRNRSLPDTEKRRLRFLGIHHTELYNLLQMCPSTSLFQFSVGPDEPAYYCSHVDVTTSVTDCLLHAQISSANAHILPNALPFCVAFWDSRRQQAQFLVQLTVASLHFEFEPSLLAEWVRRIVLQSPPPELDPITVQVISRCFSQQSSSARLAFLAAMSGNSPSLQALLQDCLTPRNEEYLTILALTTHTMMASLGFVTAESPLCDVRNAEGRRVHEYAVSGVGSDEPFQCDYVLPARFVDLSRDNRIVLQQKALVAQRATEISRLADEQRDRQSHLDARRQRARSPNRRVSLQRGVPVRAPDDLQRWYRACGTQRWPGVVSLATDGPTPQHSAAYSPGYRLPHVGERVAVPLMSIESTVRREFYSVSARFDDEQMVELSPPAMPDTGAGSIEDMERQRRVTEHYIRRNSKQSKFWEGSRLKPSDTEPAPGSLRKARQGLVNSQHDSINSTRSSPTRAVLYVPFGSMFWTSKGFWRLKDTYSDHTDIPTTEGSYAAPESPEKHDEAVVSTSSPRTLEEKTETGPDNTFLTAVPGDAEKDDAVSAEPSPPRSPSPISRKTESPPPSPSYTVASRSHAGEWHPSPRRQQQNASVVVADPQLNWHPFTQQAMEVSIAQKRRYDVLLRKRPPREPVVDPVTGQAACSQTMQLARRCCSWETQSNFFLPSLFRTKLAAQVAAQPTLPPPSLKSRPHSRASAPSSRSGSRAKTQQRPQTAEPFPLPQDLSGGAPGERIAAVPPEVAQPVDTAFMNAYFSTGDWTAANAKRSSMFKTSW
eukprot:TRINITY_DN10084_c0_g1_i1.p1 TRINITY_DN10084_c0_g1~~TRINITY_DN10084_c0_g1_i1.p1  ORF type:complete len:1035 (+),score=106.54 TRINITY_DN10084_c0_g1_i1:82-3186(+)